MKFRPLLHRIRLSIVCWVSSCAALAAQAPSPAEKPVLLIKGGSLVSMARGAEPLTRADLLVREGRIAAIGRDLPLPDGAEWIDARNQLVLPGFVDVHSHLVITAMRGLYQNTEATKFFPTTNRLAKVFEPEDAYIGILWGALELAEGGITTTVDFFDNILGPEHALAGIRALRDSGIRGRLLYGAESKITPGQIDLAHLRELAAGWSAHSAGGRLSLGLAWRLPRDLKDEAAWAMKDEEYRTARGLKLPIAVHVSGQAEAMFDALIQRSLLFPGLQVVHATDARPDQLAALQQAGGSLALTPMTEHRVGYGLTLPNHFAAVPRLGLGVDGNSLAGSADMFEIMRLAAFTQSGKDRDELAVSPRRLLELATRDGAESIGLGAETGTLETGKRADLQLIDLHALNLGFWSAGDPAALIVYSARPANVSTVVIDGRIVKRDGRLVRSDVPELLENARRSIEAVRARAGDAGKTPD